MITDINQLDFSKRYTYGDYLQWKFEERVEIIKGWVYRMSPAPGRIHQRVATRLTGEIDAFFKNRECEVYAAPFDVRIARKNAEDGEVVTVVQPDISVICNLDILDKRGCNGAPDLVVEVLSPGNTKKEMSLKFDLYQESGVKEYWLVHPTDKNVLQFVADADGKFQLHKMLTEDKVLNSPIFPGFQIKLSEVF